MEGSSSKQPLLLQLLQERRRFAELVVQMHGEKGVTPRIIGLCEREEARRRAAGARATPLGKLLIRRGLLNEREVDEARRKARSGNSSIIPAKEMETVRKAQGEPGACLEKVLVKLNLARAREIADAYAEYLHLPLAPMVRPWFGELATKRF